jgi:hypothetical protein
MDYLTNQEGEDEHTHQPANRHVDVLNVVGWFEVPSNRVRRLECEVKRPDVPTRIAQIKPQF